MMFNTIYTYKVAIFPFPSIFISAFSEVPLKNIYEATQIVTKDIVRLMDKAQQDYHAALIANEPTAQTHNLNFDNAKSGVAVYCSIKFQSVVEMNKFLTNEVKRDE